MHTFKADKDHTFTYNSDLSGNVQIRVGGNTFWFRGSAIKAFAIEIVKSELISHLESYADPRTEK